MIQTTAELQQTNHQNNKAVPRLVLQIGVAEAGVLALIAYRQDIVMTQITVEARQISQMTISLAHLVQMEIYQWI
jgi:hypothetical protein